MTTKNVTVRTDVDIDDLIEDISDQLDREMLEKIIVAIDLKVADYDFTHDIIVTLMESLKGELTKDEAEEMDKAIAMFKHVVYGGEEE